MTPGLDWLYGLRPHGIRLGLETTRELLSRMGDPQDDMAFVHVAGTNGKGSTSAIIESMVRSNGVVTGLYTSPHLLRFNERIKVCGECIDDRSVEDLLDEIAPVCASMMRDGHTPTFFEVTTVMALLHFSRSDVELAVMEVGLGGRLDATSVIVPECAVITPISMEHQRYLGDDLGSIAREKAGVIKGGVPTITSDSNAPVMGVIDDVCQKVGSKLQIVRRYKDYNVIRSDIKGNTFTYMSDEHHTPLLGEYQVENAALALAAIGVLTGEWGPMSTAEGLENVDWPGRMWIAHRDPIIMIDVTHTIQGASVVAPEARRLLGDGFSLVIGMLEDKDVEAVTREFGAVAGEVFATAPSSERAASVDRVKAAWPEAVTTRDVSEAMERAVGTGTPVLVTGSLYTAGEAMRWVSGSF